MKGNMRPFSRGDNNVLEKAWLKLSSSAELSEHVYMQKNHVQRGDAGRATEARSRAAINKIAERHLYKHGSNYQPSDAALPSKDDGSITYALTCCSNLLLDISEELQINFCSIERRVSPHLSFEYLVSAIMKILKQAKKSVTRGADVDQISADSSTARPRNDSPNQLIEDVQARLAKKVTTHGRDDDVRNMSIEKLSRPRSYSQATDASSTTQGSVGSPDSKRAGHTDHGITGKPFIRVGSLESRSEENLASKINMSAETGGAEGKSATKPLGRSGNGPLSTTEVPPPTVYAKETAEVAVGASRLHMVSLPILQMKPIYWSPVNDVAVVTRATWFYRDNMLPILPAVANQLEAGYRELRPWSETWSDEIRCAIEVGPAGEEKVSHRLWPKDDRPLRAQQLLEPVVPGDPYCAARCSQGDAAAEGSLSVQSPTDQEASNRPFLNYHVIYKNKKEAFMLKPTLKPSAYYGRRPVQKIARGVTIGIPVVRGFDVKRWEQIQHGSRPADAASAANSFCESQTGDACSACKAEQDRGQASDLVLVAHGIGQKFAERVESFHFTHAINAFRRAVNMELTNPAIRGLLRPEHTGLMILPLNWRAGLSFEDGGPAGESEKEEYAPEGFGLKDIEPDTIPAIRSMISDVMFDIPFYMSHHKGKMIKALVSEANRVYRLWCLNNPGFLENGRVHMIGHSLGSAMALEILSRQPTSVPPLNLPLPQLETRFFEFNTHNLFLVGSPAGFFLLLERGVLIPRHGREKAGADLGDSTAPSVFGESGNFGCLAVDNIYNILAKEDPIAYLLNGAVDPGYAATLQKAYVPSAGTSILKSVGDAFRSVIPGIPAAPDPLAPQVDRPSNIRLPSQLELEVHDFTREELAEKKAYLLNDNGQIDWFLRSSGGPLELQYLSMLSAHTSYWVNQDFIRMLCIEIGRKPGRANTLPAFRAVKNVKFSRGKE